MDRDEMLRAFRAFESVGLEYVLIQKFRSVEEMSAAPIRVVAEGNAFDRFVRHCGRFRLIYPRVYPRGVFRFRSLEEAQIARESPADEKYLTTPEEIHDHVENE